MDLNKSAIKEVIDLFDIAYSEDGERSSTEPTGESFSELEGNVSSVITDMEDKGEILETTSKETESVEESNLETIEDLIANSVEEAKEMTAQVITVEDDFDSIIVPVVQLNIVNKNEDIFSEEAMEDVKRQLDASCSNPELTINHGHSFDYDVVVSPEVQEQLESICSDQKLVLPQGQGFNDIDVHAEGVYPVTGNASFDNMSVKIASEVAKTSPVVLEDEDIDIIPCKDSEGNVKGEIKIKDVKDISWDSNGNAIVQGGEIIWDIESPTELYNEFYRIKEEKIDTFSCGRQLPFDRLYQDLYNCKVDISTEVLDKSLLMRHLDAVVQCIERVSMIQVQVNHQYFIWKRFVELLRGALARVQYLKPVLKQDGLIMEHMGDVEFYVQRLQAIHDSAGKIMKNLEHAFDALSRKISVMLTVQGKHIDRMSPDAYGGSNRPVYQEPMIVETLKEEVIVTPDNIQDLSDYDDFEMGIEVVSTKPKSGTVGWSEIW